jgi:hypothetical protein
MAYPEKDAIEREQVEWVHGLTGGELSDRPMRYAHKGEKWNSPTHKFVPCFERSWARYWYEGTPEWVEEFQQYEQDDRGEFLTIVWNSGAYGDHLPPTTIRSGGRKWRKVATFASSCETECPGQHEDENKVTADHVGEGEGTECVLCSAKLGGEHGMIYLGEGWLEAVYYTPPDREE